jgi:hypothetical protein
MQLKEKKKKEKRKKKKEKRKKVHNEVHWSRTYPINSK